MPRDLDLEKAADAETAKARLRQGLVRSKALVAQYRQRLAMLRLGRPPVRTEPQVQFSR